MAARGLRLARSRAFFRTIGAALLAVSPGCATSAPDWTEEGAVASARERADRWRGDGLTAVAARQFEDAALLAAQARDPWLESRSLLDAAECWIADDREEVARVDLEKAARAIALLPPGSVRQRSAHMRAASLAGDVELKEGRPGEAGARYEEALGLAVGNERDAVLLRLALARELRGDAKGGRALRRQLADPADPRLVELERVLSTAPAPSRSAETSVPPATNARPVDAPAAPRPTIVPRATWGARSSRSNLERMSRIRRITVHHTATRLSSTQTAAVASALRSLQRQHQDGKGWADLGYHFLIDPSGRIWEGRPLHWQGAHAGSPELNVGNVGIALFGDFTRERPSSAQERSLVALLEWLRARHGLDRSEVRTHSEIRPGPTECPGPALQRVIDRWRAVKPVRA